MITRDLIVQLNPQHPNPDVAAAKLQAAATRWGITSVRQVAMLLAQLTHESRLVPIEENLNYSARRIMQVWPSRFPNLDIAQQCAYNPQALANRVYGGRNGNTRPGDGWLYHGRGMIQLTFRDNYVLHGARIGYPLGTQPELLLQYGISALVAGSFWNLYSLNGPADRGDVRAVTYAINGGMHGLDDRERQYQRALGYLRPRLGLLEAEGEVATDEQADLDARSDGFNHVLSLLTS